MRIIDPGWPWVEGHWQPVRWAWLS